MEQLELPFGDEIRKLSEEIVDDKSKKYIYESIVELEDQRKSGFR